MMDVVLALEVGGEMRADPEASRGERKVKRTELGVTPRRSWPVPAGACRSIGAAARISAPYYPINR